MGRVGFVMAPGDITEEVTVLGQSPIIDADNAEGGAVIEEGKILDLPLRPRSLVKLANLTTGATQLNGNVADTSGYVFGGGYPSFNGLCAAWSFRCVCRAGTEEPVRIGRYTSMWLR